MRLLYINMPRKISGAWTRSQFLEKGLWPCDARESLSVMLRGGVFWFFSGNEGWEEFTNTRSPSCEYILRDFYIYTCLRELVAHGLGRNFSKKGYGPVTCASLVGDPKRGSFLVLFLERGVG